MRIWRLQRYLLVSVLFVCAASAQELPSGTARVTTQALGAIPDGQTISVEAENDTELNDRLAREIRRELRSRRLNPGRAGLTLRFATAMPEFGAPARQRNVEIEGRGGSRGRSTITGVLKVPLGKSKQPQQEPAGQEPQVRLRLDLLSPDGKPLWTGEIATARGNADRYAVLTRLVPVLLDRFGKTTSNAFVPYD